MRRGSRSPAELRPPRAAPGPEQHRLPSDGRPSFPSMGGFRRALLGYRRAEVDSAITARDLRIAEWEKAVAERDGRLRELDGEMVCLSRMVLERERESAGLREQLQAAEERHERSLDQLEMIVQRVEELQAAARGQATRIRMKALREAVEVSERANSLTQRMDFAGHGGLAVDGEAEIESAADADPEAGAETVEVPLQEGSVEVEVGPLSDFSQLLAFQEAAEGLGAVDGVRLERFSDGCATLIVSLSEPMDLAAALQEAAPLALQQRGATSGAIAFDVPAAGTRAA